MPRRRMPPDVARVVDDFRDLGEAARRGLHVSEKVTKKQVEKAAKDARALRDASQRRRRS